VTQDNLFFIALVLPEPERSVIQQIKEKCAEDYGAVHALKSPPHITLIPPFRIAKQDDGLVFSFLEDFAAGCRPFIISVNGFGCFKPRVIFANPVPEVAMAALHEKLDARFYDIISAKRPVRKGFHPHITIAFKDLSPRIFNDVWEIFKNKPLLFSFQIDRLALLKHDGQRWNIHKEFVFSPCGLQN
jgi:2'-5' RNA ligase